MTLYKYVPADIGIQILMSKTIRFSKLNTLPDPFEANFNLNYQYDEESIINKFNRSLNKNGFAKLVASQIADDMYNQLLSNTNEYISKEEFFDRMTNVLNFRLGTHGLSFIDHLEKNTNRLKPQIANIFCDNLSGSVADDVAVLCLTTSDDDDQMWEYFANGHSGIVIGFDSRDPFFAKGISVIYEDGKKNCNYDMAIPVERQPLEVLQNAFGYKKLRYFFEQEYRVFISSRHLQKVFKKDELGNDVQVMDTRGIEVLVKNLPTDAVNTIIFGNNVLPTNKSEIIANLKPYKNVVRKRARVDAKLNKIRIENDI